MSAVWWRNLRRALLWRAFPWRVSVSVARRPRPELIPPWPPWGRRPPERTQAPEPTGRPAVRVPRPRRTYVPVEGCLVDQYDGMEEKFFAYCRERYEMLLRRWAGEDPPWTTDPVLARYRFCNVFREDDRTTEYVRDHVRSLRLGPNQLLDAIIVARWFNRIETIELLGREPSLLTHWRSDEARERLAGHEPLTNAAYRVPSPRGMRKLDGLIWCVENALRLRSLDDPAAKDRMWEFRQALVDSMNGGPHPTMEQAVDALSGLPYMGRFMAYEVACDLRHTPLMDRAPDLLTWANPGPGAFRGLGWLQYGDPEAITGRGREVERRAINDMQVLLRCAREDSECWPEEWPRWEMREVEHSLCEFDKYMRAKGGQPLKRGYRAG